VSELHRGSGGLGKRLLGLVTCRCLIRVCAGRSRGGGGERGWVDAIDVLGISGRAREARMNVKTDHALCAYRL
jgi:hypothetical protein